MECKYGTNVPGEEGRLCRACLIWCWSTAESFVHPQEPVLFPAPEVGQKFFGGRTAGQILATSQNKFGDSKGHSDQG